jgi:hypothetical protein
MGRSVLFGLRAAGLALAAALGMASSLPAAISVTLSDPQNDTFGTLSPQLDIKELRVEAVDSSGNSPGNTHLKFKLGFYTPISPPSWPRPRSDALYGMILIDINNDADMASVLNQLITNPSLDLASNGVEYFIDLSSEQFNNLGVVDVVDTSTNTAVATPSIAYSPGPTFFDVFVTLDRTDINLNNNSNVDIRFGAIVGNANESTDVVPNIPEPSSALLIGGLLVGLAGLARWRNRRQGRP